MVEPSPRWPPACRGRRALVPGQRPAGCGTGAEAVVCIVLVCTALFSPVVHAAEYAAPPSRPEPRSATPTAATALSNETRRRSAIELGMDGRFSEAVQKLRALYRQTLQISLLLDIMEIHRHAGDAPGVLTVSQEYEQINPHPSAMVREQLSACRSWAQQPLAVRNRSLPPGQRVASEVAPGSGNLRHLRAASPAVDPPPVLAPPAPAPAPPSPPAEVSARLSPLPVAAKPAVRPRRRLPVWGQAVIGVLGGGAAVALGAGLGIYFNPQRDYPVYPSMVH